MECTVWFRMTSKEMRSADVYPPLDKVQQMFGLATMGRRAAAGHKDDQRTA